MKVSLLIAPSQEVEAFRARVQARAPGHFLDKMFEGSYSLGWLICDDTRCYWDIWGNAANREKALQAAKRVVATKGPVEVLVWDETLPCDLTVEQVEQIRRRQVR